MLEYQTITLPAADLDLIGVIETLIPRHARSVVLLHGEDGEPAVYRVRASEARLVRAAIREARARRDLRTIGA